MKFLLFYFKYNVLYVRLYKILFIFIDIWWRVSKRFHLLKQSSTKRFTQLKEIAFLYFSTHLRVIWYLKSNLEVKHACATQF